MRIKSLKRIKQDCKVFDIEVDVDHSFIVQECILHNCVICGANDGKLYKSLKDAPELPQHRGCVTGDTLVSSVERISKVYRRRYKGLLYCITTASGNTLTVTPNHPVLTDKGFVRAHLLNIGDNVISDNGLEFLHIHGKDEDYGKASIKDVFRSFRKSPSVFSCSVPVAAEDFHGDAVYNKVDIVTSYWKLGSKRDVSGFKLLHKNSLVNGNSESTLGNETHKCGIFQVFHRRFSAFGSLMGSLSKLGDLLWTGITHPLNLLFMPISLGNVVSFEECNHCGTSIAESLCNPGNPDSLVVKLKNFINRKIVGRALASSIDVGPVQGDPDDVFGRTVLAGNILDGYSAQIKPDNIVAIDVVYSFTHVYNLETENNWYVANGIITHNCRCVLLPYFDIEGDFRASKNGYVDSKTNFEGWLKEQDEKTQREVLGATRYELFKKGEPMKQFVDSGRLLTLEELNQRLGKDS